MSALVRPGSTNSNAVSIVFPAQRRMPAAAAPNRATDFGQVATAQRMRTGNAHTRIDDAPSQPVLMQI
jgi:hypothetical protein